MAQSRIRLKQLDPEVFDYFDDLVIKHSGSLLKDFSLEWIEIYINGERIR